MEELKYVIEDSTIAELLGVQNFSTDEAAILELVKNAYDANALNLKITFENDMLRFEDNGIGMTKERLNQVRGGLTTKIEDSNDFYGLYNVNERIRLKFGEEYGLSIDSVLQEGTCVEVWLPWES